MLIEALWTHQLNWCLYWCFRGHDTCMTHIHCILVTCHRLCTQAKSVGSCASLAGWSGTLASPALSLSFVYRLKGKL